MGKNKVLCYVVSIIICLPLLSTTCEEDYYEVLKVENMTDVPIIVVLSRDNLYPYWTHYNNMLGVIEAGGSANQLSDVSRKEYFSRVSVVQVLVYDASDVGDDLGQFFKYASQNQCYMVRYLFTPKELCAMGWTVTVTPDDVIDYRRGQDGDIIAEDK